MTELRDRILKGVFIPANQEVKGSVDELPLKRWMEKANIHFPSRVHGANSRGRDFMMVVDDAGHDRELAWNPRAQFLSGYPMNHPIVGDAIFFSEAFIDDGMEFIHINKLAELWLTDMARLSEFANWRREYQEGFAYYLGMYPGKPPVKAPTEK